LGFLSWFRNDSVQLTEDYRLYTRRYDREVSAERLYSVLGPVNSLSKADRESVWQEYVHGLAALKARCGFQILELATQLREKLTPEGCSQTLVSILIDQSGSMRGPKMLLTAMAADVLQAGLSDIGIRSEVLGFTTVGWHGGRSRKRWNWLGRPARPGRLCDLLHVIYKDAADIRASTDGWAFHEMLRPDLPRENVDGEAVEWAVSRMRARPEMRKLLIVVSDGAPVDDSTLLENGPDYLSNHLKAVVAKLVADGDIYLGALGVGHDAGSYYPISENIEVPDDIFPALCRLITVTLSSSV